MTVTKQTLRDSRYLGRLVGQELLLRCRSCLAEYSANPSDYFMVSDDEPLEHCGAGMQLMCRKIVLEVIAE